VLSVNDIAAWGISMNPFPAQRNRPVAPSSIWAVVSPVRGSMTSTGPPVVASTKPVLSPTMSS